MPTVMFADANRELRDLYARALASFGFEVETVDSALECVAHLRQSSPDVLILDSNLPWGGSDGVLSVMRKCSELAEIPVILTAIPGSSASADANAPPVVRTVTKPLSLYELLKSVRGSLTEPEPVPFPWDRDSIPSEIYIG